MNLRWDSIPRSLVGLLLASLLLASCHRSAQRGAVPADGAGAAYLLAAEPSGARSVLEIRADLEGRDQPAEAISVVMVGRVGGVDGLTWDPNRAAFVVRDVAIVEEEADEHAHDADSCPFCRAKKKKLLASTALVQIVDAQGQVPAVDARKLLGLSEGLTIVVRGNAQLDGLGNVTVQAAGVYVRSTASETAS